MAVTIDTYQAHKTLTADKAFSEIQAERLLDILSDSNEMLATKADIQVLDMKIDNLRGELKSDIDGLRVEIHSEIKSVRADVEILKKDLTIKMYTLFATSTAILLAAIKYL